MKEGILLSGYGSFYTVKTDDGKVEARARGRLKKDNVKLYIGDKVELENEKGTYAITGVKDRKNFLIRPAVANVDQIIVVVANASPNPNFKQIDKLLTFLEYKGLDVIICVNKTDLDGIFDLKGVYEKAGYRVVSTVAKDIESESAELKDILKDKISAFAGCSGVGKSSLINLIKKTGERTTGDIGKTNRGRHTTTHASLIELEFGGLIADTPGFSVVDLTLIPKDELKDCFIEFLDFEGKCKFNGCTHIKEPGCTVKNAVENGLISQSRYNSYTEIYEELSDLIPSYK